MIYGLGMQELLVILAIVMLLFGGKKLPEVGRNLGKAIRGFKESEEETIKELKKAAEGDASDEATEDESPETTEEAQKEERAEEEEKRGDEAT